MKLFAKLIDKLGTPGALLGVLYIIFISCSNETQRTEFVDKFFLLKAEPNHIILAITIFFVLLLYLMNIHYSNLINIKEIEIVRLSEFKSNHQKSNITHRIPINSNNH